jgi:hypothetical protein
LEGERRTFGAPAAALLSLAEGLEADADGLGELRLLEAGEVVKESHVLASPAPPGIRRFRTLVLMPWTRLLRSAQGLAAAGFQ